MTEPFPDLRAAAAAVVEAQAALDRLNYLRTMLEAHMSAAVYELRRAADQRFFTDTEAMFGDESPPSLTLVEDARPS